MALAYALPAETGPAGTPDDGSQLNVLVEADPRAVARARRAVSGFASGFAIDEAKLADVGLAVGEACTAILRGSAGSDGAIEVSARGCRNGLEVAVCERGRGRGLNPLGSALPIVAALTDTLVMTRDHAGACALMTFALSPPRVSPSG